MSDSLAVAAFRTSLPIRSSSSLLGLFELSIAKSPAVSVYRAHHQKTMENRGKLQEISLVFKCLDLINRVAAPAADSLARGAPAPSPWISTSWSLRQFRPPKSLPHPAGSTPIDRRHLAAPAAWSPGPGT